MDIQCDAQYKLKDKDGNLVVTFFCLKERGHDGDHEHTLVWKEHKHDSIMGS